MRGSRKCELRQEFLGQSERKSKHWRILISSSDAEVQILWRVCMVKREGCGVVEVEIVGAGLI